MTNCIEIQLTHSPVVNYAMHQNHIPLLQSVTLTHLGDETLTGLMLQVDFDVPLAAPFSRGIDALEKGQVLEIRPIALELNAGYLLEQSERTPARLRVRVTKDGQTLAEASAPLDVLAFDECYGFTLLPELLAAFVQPNAQDVIGLAQSASALLGQWTGDPSLDAYQSGNLNRVRLQAAAAYSALAQCGVTYCEPPAHFERLGQRVRLPDQVLRTHMGTCLDLALLYCGVLESMGLHPLLVLTRGHAFAAVWLEKTTFPETVQDDPAALVKRMAEGLRTLVAVECTALCAGRAVGFDEAVGLAERTLSRPEEFECAVDIKRARLGGVHPLPERLKTDAGWTIKPFEPPAGQTSAKPRAIGENVQVRDGEGVPARTRLEAWQRRLLDLSLRNNLVSLRLTQSVLPLLAGDLRALEDGLSSGKDYQVLERPADWDHPLKDARLYEWRTGSSPIDGLLAGDLESGRIRTPLTEAELNRSATHIWRNARLSLEENGANTLYLALGTLKWFETEQSEQPRYAPLVLLPVDLLKKTARRGFTLRLRDEEPQMNITLLEMLRQDFGLDIGGLDPLPSDEHGVDLTTVFAVLRQAVMQKRRWDVVENAFLGIFSFAQFVMWNDVRNRASDLAQNKLVASLLKGQLTAEPQPVPPPEDLEGALLLPIPADASQMHAVYDAACGRSFVLHGPPGTGKSQTITNMIANALARGKSVLFVAEKMAALSVVEKRLDEIGVGDFCLELHSNKSRKKDLLDQLQRVIDLSHAQPPEGFEARAQQLKDLRDQLSGQVRALHLRGEAGLSLYEAIAAWEGLSDVRDRVRFSAEDAAALTPDRLRHNELLVSSLVAAARALGHPAQNPLRELGQTRFAQDLPQRAGDVLSGYAGALRALSDATAQLCALFELPSAENAQAQERLRGLARVLESLLGLPAALLAEQARDDGFALHLTDYCRHGLAMEEHRSKVTATLHPDALTLPAGALRGEWNTASAQWALPRAMGQGRVRKQLQAYVSGRKIQNQEVLPLLNEIDAFQQEQQAANALAAGLAPRFVHSQDGFAAGAERAQVLQAGWGALCSQVREPRAAQLLTVCARNPAASEAIGAYLAAYSGLNAAQEQLVQTLQPRSGIFFSEANPALADCLALCGQWQENLSGLRAHVHWSEQREAAQQSGLGALVAAYEDAADPLGHEEAAACYEKGVYRALIDRLFAGDPALSGFSGAVFEDKIASYRRLMEQYTQLTRQYLFAVLAARVPNLTQAAAHTSEVGILQRAIRSGGRGVSIRRLMEQLATLLPRLCPCMLMSPLSAAQYLDPKREAFDLVIFDEASQMPTCKAVGVLARGREAVIVGDPKQMPPTTFFSSNATDEDHPETEDLESILDDCLALSMPDRHLTCHYRSRHESLIAFSNAVYYDSRLVTFPSANDLTSRVRLVPCGGSYDRGRTKQNRAEAEAIVAEIERRLRNEPQRSLGVVTFSSVQQELIDDLLTERFRADEELEKRALHGEEPLFIKNLENVQGDERDVILFSVGYGPDAQGRVALNFGPLNRDGGSRRLNVAVSRAREEMVVFSTLRPDQLDTTRTASQGVMDLKRFLEYAQRGTMPARPGAHALPADGLAQRIASLLRQQGYDVHLQVGRSDFRVDVGVVDPRQPGQYLLGILLDGSGYAQTETVYDREMTRVSVLERLGWHLVRVWAIDWWSDEQAGLARLCSAIEALLEAPASPQEAPEPEPAPEPTSEAAPDYAARPEPLSPDTIPQPAVPQSAARPYVMADLPLTPLSAEEFVYPENRAALEDKLMEVIYTEGMVSQALLYRRVLNSYALTRSGPRIARFVQETLAGLPVLSSDQDGMPFYRIKAWRDDGSYRVGQSEESRREAKDLPYPEIANAACEVLRSQFGLPKEDLARETAKLFGFTRMGAALEACMEAGIALALDQGRAIERGGVIVPAE